MSTDPARFDFHVPSALAIQRDAIGGVGLTLVAASMALFGGPIGIPVAAFTIVGGALLPSLVAFASIQILTLAVFSSPGPAEVIVVQIGLFAVVTEPFRESEGWVRLTTVATALFGGFAAVIVLTSARVPHAWAAAFLITLVAVLIYGCHRYVRVQLGLARATHEETNSNE